MATERELRIVKVTRYLLTASEKKQVGCHHFFKSQLVDQFDSEASALRAARAIGDRDGAEIVNMVGMQE